MVLLDLNRVLARLIFIAICIKLIASPWATGDFEGPTGKLINSVCDLTVIVAVLLSMLQMQKQFVFIYIAAIASGLGYAISTYFYADLSPLAMLSKHLKIYLPILSFPIFLSFYKRDKQAFYRMTKFLCLLIASLLAIGLVTLPDSMNRLQSWWPSYFGGLHSTAYVAFMVMLLIVALNNHFQLGTQFALLSIVALSFSIYFGWGVRTATLASLVFLIGILIENLYWQGIKLKHSLPLVTATIGGVFLLIVPFINFQGRFDEFTSGRLSMYMDKYEQLAGNSLGQWIVGNGYGSDLIETDIWWWAAKGAHSDLITMLVEGGLFYLLFFVTTIFGLWKLSNWKMKCVLAAVLTTTAVSNGVFVRPVAGYMFALALVLFYESVNIEKEAK